MRTILKKFIMTIFLVILMTFISFPVKAIVCEYPDAGLNVTYNENNAPTIDYDKFSNGNFYTNAILFKWGESRYSTDEIKVDQTLFEKYGGSSCPSGLKVCETAKMNIALPSVYSLTTLLGSFPCAFGFLSNDQCLSITRDQYSVISHVKELYIFTEEEYRKSEISKYANSGGFVSNSLHDSFNEGYDFGSGYDIPILSNITGFLSGVVWTALDGIIYDTVIGSGGGMELYYTNAKCTTVDYSGPYPSFNINCGLLTESVLKFVNNIDLYKNCGADNSCKINITKEINSTENNIKSQCSKILQSYDYKDGQKECIETCLTIRDTLNGYKKGTDLYIEYSDKSGDCGFSQKLLVWISNILKWIKYILPVVVIILSILDFIKAIAADKDDEMKKAQSKFIRRLIAAALVFIVPLILEFILDKMGFGYNSCDLF